MEGYIDLKKLNLQELVGVVNIYPWFSLARKELCERMCTMGDWGMSQYAEAAMYMSDRKVLAKLLRKVEAQDYSDKNISDILNRWVKPEAEQAAAAPAQAGSAAPVQNKPRVVVAGGDYFTQAEYEKVRRQDDNVFAGYAVAGRNTDVVAAPETHGTEFDFCTETLAQIYAEQGYYEQAKQIYSKLILAYPEKNVYFAALIEKLNVENQNL